MSTGADQPIGLPTGMQSAATAGASFSPTEGASAMAAAAGLNFVSISLDDLNAFVFLKTLYGGTLQTPNIDRLMAMGTTFENGYSQVAICNASRTSVLTGQNPGLTGVHANTELWYDFVDPASTFPAWLKSAGYDTGVVGKVFHYLGMPEEVASVVADYTFASGENRFLGGGLFDAQPMEGPIESHSDHINVESAIDRINQAGDDPFAMFVGISKPHLGWVVPQEFFDLYPLDQIDLPYFIEGDLSDVPAFMQDRVLDHVHDAVLDAGFWKSALQGYFASISFADAMVGKLLDSLEANGQIDNTVIALWTDHGYHLGDKDNWHKFTLWEEAARAPFIIAMPGQDDNGQRVEQPVELVDIMPTILDILQVEAPPGLSGRSLLPFIQNPDLRDEGTAVTTMYGSASLRAGDYRYILYEDGSTELYDLQADPNQWHNLAARPGYAGVESRLDGVLRQELAEDGWIWASANTIAGTGQDDIVVVAPGARKVIGGGGDDTYFVSDKDAVLVEMTGGGNDTVYTSSDYRLPDGVENLYLKLRSASREVLGNSLANFIQGTGTLHGLGGDDVLEGSGFDDLLFGSAGNDSLFGGAGFDILEGGSGSDILDGSTGSDIMRGNAGNDLYYLDNAADVIEEKFDSGIDTVSTRSSHRLGVNLENLILTAGATHGYGNNVSNRIIGTGAGNRLDGGGGADFMQGGRGADVYVVDHPGDVVSELATDPGWDTILSSVSYTLLAGQDCLMLTGDRSTSGFGNGLANLLVGNVGANFFDGGLGADKMRGGAGNDIYVVEHGRDLIFEAFDEGYDVVQSSISHSLGLNVETLFLTGAGSVNGFGNELSNRITGTAAANRLDGRAGADWLAGGLGDDTYVVDDPRDIVIEGVNKGYDTAESSISLALSGGLERLVLTGTASLVGSGNAADNVLIGNRGDNGLAGGDGADLIDGGIGRDKMYGGRGNDKYVVERSDDRVFEDINAGVDVVEASASFILGANVENLVLLGTARAGVGNAGSNSLIGNRHSNVLDGQVGADLLQGGAGDDLYVVDHHGDRVVEAKWGGIDTVRSSITFHLAAGVETLNLAGHDGISGFGNSAANTILGNAAANQLNGQGGADFLIGGLGSDTYVVDHRLDRLLEGRDAGTDVVFSSVNWQFTNNIEKLILTGVNNLSATGNTLGNTIVGNSGSNALFGLGGGDVIQGNEGLDILSGGLGNDVLVGGSDRDRFVFDAALNAVNNVDTIVDFNSEDAIHLKASIFEAFDSLGVLSERAFAIGRAAVDADTRIIFDNASGCIYYDSDGSGAGSAVLFARVGSDTILAASDFVIVA